jgi:hypothetical protein
MGMILEMFPGIIKPTIESWIQIFINNEKLLRVLLLGTLGFVNSFLKTSMDIWVRSCYKNPTKKDKNFGLRNISRTKDTKNQSHSLCS